MEAVGDEAEVFPEGPWMQDWTTFPPNFTNAVGTISSPFGKTIALGFRGDFFICEDE